MRTHRAVMSNRDRVLVALVVALLAVSGYLAYYNIQRLRADQPVLSGAMEQAMRTNPAATGGRSGNQDLSPAKLLSDPVLQQLRYHVPPIAVAGLVTGRADIFLPPATR